MQPHFKGHTALPLNGGLTAADCEPLVALGEPATEYRLYRFWQVGDADYRKMPTPAHAAAVIRAGWGDGAMVIGLEEFDPENGKWYEWDRDGSKFEEVFSID